MLFEHPPMKPGELLKTILKEKAWTQDELADITGRSKTHINDIVTGKTGITPDMAVALAAAVGNKPTDWLELEARFRLSQAHENAEVIERRARLYNFAPVKDMEKRGWIQKSDRIEQREKEVCKFFGIASLDESPSLSASTRRSTENLTAIQRAWCFRAKQLGTALQVNPYRPELMDPLLRKLRRFAAYPKEASHVAEAMREHGIRFVVIESLPGGKIDGVTTWLNESAPLIAVSIRFDRIDNFWFTLFHEIMHVQRGDALSIDCDLGSETFTAYGAEIEAEQMANEGAENILIPTPDLDSFVLRTAPLYSTEKIIQFAHSVKIHPGIVVGQIHHRDPKRYRYFREMLKPVREFVVSTALTDGWGKSISPTVFDER